MTTTRNFRTLFAATLALALGLIAHTTALAASDYLLEIDGPKGKQVVPFNDNNAEITLQDLPVGNYKFTVKQRSGAALEGTGQLTLNVQPADVDSDGPAETRKTFVLPHVLERSGATSHEVKNPRDAASGLPTGKRQHKPLIFTKRMDKSSPVIYQLSQAASSVTIKASYDLATNKKI
ncbi:MAG: type VI secretion system tube protein Hcp [Armatimonadetes bacterium]|nr:type VI secretion system tube protein Hcp [Armatimonadota bacterium]